jgi:acetoin utilization protein AcuB
MGLKKAVARRRMFGLLSGAYSFLGDIEMLVRDWMSKRLIALDVKDSVQDAIVRLREHEISRLPVLDQGNLVGIVTDRDLRRFWPSAASKALEIKDLIYMALNTAVELVMTKDPITVPYTYTMQETAEVLLDNNISGCPVVDDQGVAVGMITRNDLFKALVSWSGIRKEGIQVGFLLEDRPGCICMIINAIRKHNGRITSLMSSNQGAPDHFRYVTVMTYNLAMEEVQKIRSELSYQAKMLYMVDRRMKKREVYTS